MPANKEGVYSVIMSLVRDGGGVEKGLDKKGREKLKVRFYV